MWLSVCSSYDNSIPFHNSLLESVSRQACGGQFSLMITYLLLVCVFKQAFIASLFLYCGIDWFKTVIYAGLDFAKCVHWNIIPAWRIKPRMAFAINFLTWYRLYSHWLIEIIIDENNNLSILCNLLSLIYFLNFQVSWRKIEIHSVQTFFS